MALIRSTPMKYNSCGIWTCDAHLMRYWLCRCSSCFSLGLRARLENPGNCRSGNALTAWLTKSFLIPVSRIVIPRLHQ